MQIEYSKKFIKEFKKCPDNIKTAFKTRLTLFIDDEFNPILNNHSLNGDLKKYRSINVTGDWRALFQPIDLTDIKYFIAIGPHGKLYSWKSPIFWGLLLVVCYLLLDLLTNFP